jgi:hypothetical protein
VVDTGHLFKLHRMKSVYTILPIYDSLAKRDWQRTGALIPVYCPRHRLPSFQYNTEAVVVGAVTRIDLVNFAGTLTDITTYFPTLSDTVVLATTGTYYKYDGDTLKYLLPYGNYYLKITHANGYVYYSEWIAITDIYEKLVTSWTNNGYNTFTSTGSAITSAIETGIAGQSDSNAFTLNPGENITVVFFLTKVGADPNQLPTITLEDAAGSDTETCIAGLNVLSLTSVIGGSCILFFANSSAGNFTTSEVYVIRAFSPDYIRIDFHDTHDLGDICYQSGFTQSLWLSTPMNTPTHEPVMVGEEKNGIFIAEKIVTKYNYRIVAYISPVFYRGLIRLPQHDAISITDEVGFVYTPAVGNIEVRPVNWNWFDTGTVEIIFNDNSEFIWVSDTNNLS